MKEFKPGVYGMGPVGQWIEGQENRIKGLQEDIDSILVLLQMNKQAGKDIVLPGTPTEEVIKAIKPSDIIKGYKGEPMDLGMKRYYTQFLSESENEWIVEDHFIWTGIHRCGDTLDIFDTTSIAYASSLVQIRVNDTPICNIDWDIAILPENPEYSFQLPVPIILKANDRVVLSGGTGTSVEFGLQGFWVGKPPTIKRFPYFYAAYLDEDDTSYEIVVASYMKDVKLHSVWALKRVKPSDSDNIYYLDYDDSVESAADGTYTGNTPFNMQYNNIRGGENTILKDVTNTIKWTGTRENPRPFQDLILQPYSNMTVKTTAESPAVGADIYKWLIFAGSYAR